jgi:hypothetical protein
MVGEKIKNFLKRLARSAVNCSSLRAFVPLGLCVSSLPQINPSCQKSGQNPTESYQKMNSIIFKINLAAGRSFSHNLHQQFIFVNSMLPLVTLCKPLSHLVTPFLKKIITQTFSINISKFPTNPPQMPKKHPLFTISKNAETKCP